MLARRHFTSSWVTNWIIWWDAGEHLTVPQSDLQFLSAAQPGLCTPTFACFAGQSSWRNHSQSVRPIPEGPRSSLSGFQGRHRVSLEVAAQRLGQYLGREHERRLHERMKALCTRHAS